MNGTIWGIIGLSLIIIVVSIMLYKSNQKTAQYANDLVAVAKNYNAIEGGGTSTLKDTDLQVLTLLSTGFLSTSPEGAPM